MAIFSKNEKIPIVILIGGGSKLPALLKAARHPKSNFCIRLIVSHKADSLGVKYAILHKIPAIYFKLPDFRNRLYNKRKKSREEYMKTLGWFISQREYVPKLLVFAGWDLIMDKNFFNFFKSNIGNGYAAINLHPAILPQKNEKKHIKLPDGTLTPVIKGEQYEVLETVIKNKLTYFGPTVHFMKASEFDSGTVIEREFIKVGTAKTVEDLRKKLMPVEDRVLINSINKVITKYLL